MYNADGDKQKPRPLPNKAFPNAFQPTLMRIYERCDSVIISPGASGSCFLLYNTTGSLGTTLHKSISSHSFAGNSDAPSHELGGKIYDDSTAIKGVFELPIGAQAWSGSDGFNAASITFVYKGGLDGQGRP